MKISAILLAAGSSKRIGTAEKPINKLQIVFRGKTLFAHACSLLESLPVDEKIIITKKENPDHEQGISSSIRAGVKRAHGTHYLFLGADQPLLEAEDITAIIEASKHNPDKIVYPLIDGEPCNPVMFPAAFRERLCRLNGDTGGRVIRDANPEQCLSITPEHPERFIDIDYQKDIDELNTEG